MKDDCPYCGKRITHDGKGSYVQCPFCGEISRFYFNKLVETEQNIFNIKMRI